LGLKARVPDDRYLGYAFAPEREADGIAPETKLSGDAGRPVCVTCAPRR
jgi:hypothetical protein